MFVAVKIYRLETSSFDNMWEYIKGDPRYDGVRHNKRGLIYAWAQKEYSNLMKAYSAGVGVPKPFTFRENVLVMEFIGSKKSAAPTAKNLPPSNPEEWYKKLMGYIKINSSIGSDLQMLRESIKEKTVRIGKLNQQNRYLLEHANSIVKQTISILLKSQTRPLLDRKV